MKVVGIQEWLRNGHRRCPPCDNVLVLILVLALTLSSFILVFVLVCPPRDPVIFVIPRPSSSSLPDPRNMAGWALHARPALKKIAKFARWLPRISILSNSYTGPWGREGGMAMNSTIEQNKSKSRTSTKFKMVSFNQKLHTVFLGTL